MNENPQQVAKAITDEGAIDPADKYLDQIVEGNLPPELSTKVAEANKTFAGLQDPGLTRILPETQRELINHIKNGGTDLQLDTFLAQILHEMKRGVLDFNNLDPELLDLLKNKQSQESIPG